MNQINKVNNKREDNSSLMFLSTMYIAHAFELHEYIVQDTGLIGEALNDYVFSKDLKELESLHYRGSAQRCLKTGKLL